MKLTHTKAESSLGVIDIYTITNASGASVSLSSLGAGILAVNVPDAHNQIGNVVLGYANPADYAYDGPCMGKTPGRYANRIAKGRFDIDGQQFQLAVNNGPNHLHGGPDGFQNRIWESRAEGDNKVIFTRLSPDGEESYPGELQASVEYEWTEDNQLIIRYSAVTDKPTVVNLTNHAYWNLRGEYAGCALNHWLTINANYYLPTDDTLIPTGEIAPVASTPMDFTSPKRVAADIQKDFPALIFGKGYDNCWMINNYRRGVERHAATLRCDITGRSLQVFTTMPAVQVYSGNWLAGCPKSVSGHDYADYDGIAIECQYAPDSPNKPQFPSPVLRPGQLWQESIRFVFTTQPDL